ncbi:MAG: hypothetical protein M0R51_14935 [Clostridia bacterium]|jgi:hypothetical protein|nr:hypothetical protein [Clostridia bacterium]
MMNIGVLNEVIAQAHTVWKYKNDFDIVNPSDIKLDGVSPKDIFSILWNHGIIYEKKKGIYGYIKEE